VSSVTADLIICLLTPDLDWDQYLDLTARSFGPTDEARVRANIGPIVADGRCLGAFEGDRMVGTAMFYDMRQWWRGRAVPMAAADAAPPGALRRPGPGDAAHVLDIIGRAYALARDCGPMTYDEATVRRWLTRPGRYADANRYAYLAPDGFLAYRWRRGHDEIVVEQVAAASAGTTRAAFLDSERARVTARAQMLRSPGRGVWGAGSPPQTGGHRGVAPGGEHSPLGAGHLPLQLGARGLAALYADTPVAALRRASLASGGSPAADALDGAFAATPYMLDSF
jgi:Acetyltransferase (GNAT) domain